MPEPNSQERRTRKIQWDPMKVTCAIIIGSFLCFAFLMHEGDINTSRKMRIGKARPKYDMVPAKIPGGRVENAKGPTPTSASKRAGVDTSSNPAVFAKPDPFFSESESTSGPLVAKLSASKPAVAAASKPAVAAASTSVVVAAPEPANVVAASEPAAVGTVSDPVVAADQGPSPVAATAATEPVVAAAATEPVVVAAATEPVVAATEPAVAVAPQPADVAPTSESRVVDAPESAVTVESPAVVNQPEVEEQVDDKEAETSEKEDEGVAVSEIPEAVLNFEVDHPSAPKVAYVIPILSCEESSSTPDENTHLPAGDVALYDAAAVLAHSIKKNSIHGSGSNSQYSFDLIAMFHPEVTTCGGIDRSLLLKSLGYKIMVMDIPVPLKDMQSEYLRSSIGRVGDTGEKDWVKINVFSLEHYPIAVLLNIKTIIIQPLDELFNLFSRPKEDLQSIFSGQVVPTSKSHKDLEPTELNLLFTRTYTSIEPQNFATGINTAFMILRPSLSTFNKMKDILKTASYNYANGWGAQEGRKSFYRSAQTGGFLSYFFTDIQPHTSLELDRCVYGNIADIPFIRVEGNKVCRDTRLPFGGDHCRDCRDAPTENIRSVNFAVCREPWSCISTSIMSPSCKNLHILWHQLRMDLGTVGGRHACTAPGYENYVKLKQPDLSQLAQI